MYNTKIITGVIPIARCSPLTAERVLFRRLMSDAIEAPHAFTSPHVNCVSVAHEGVRGARHVIVTTFLTSRVAVVVGYRWEIRKPNATGIDWRTRIGREQVGDKIYASEVLIAF